MKMNNLRSWALIIMAATIPVRQAAGEEWEDYGIYQWQETRARFGIGVDYFGVGSQQDSAPAVSWRYRLSPQPWPKSEDLPWHLGPVPLNVCLEAGSILPHSGSSLRMIRFIPNSQTQDIA